MPEERLQKILSRAGVASRRKAEQLILEGRVRVNGAVVTELGSKADLDRDHIKVDGHLLHNPRHLLYIAMNKPTSVVTTVQDPQRRTTVMDLLHGVRERVYPVGRLDYHSEGLLLLTNDGDFAN
ncbi:MAG TPA: S4 domain-containing protein, partial [Bryobacteraceae bacterium]|nr:S4 domain-containing protein [Bryobacteraceae bacterium]